MAPTDSQEDGKLRPGDVFLKAALYTPLPRELAGGVENFDETLDLFCPGCNKESVYKRHDRTPNQAMAMSPGAFGMGHYGERPASREFSAEFTCQRNDEHKALFYFWLDDSRFTKIGEYPSLNDRLSPELQRYQKLLGNYSGELRTALRLHTHGVGIGAFVYLRRILETLVVEAATVKYAQQQDWSLEEWRKGKGRFQDMVSDLSDCLPDFLIGNQSLYAVLSTGIHDLHEEECLLFFDVVKQAIMEILDERVRSQEKDKRRKAVGAELASIKRGLGRKRARGKESL